MSETSGKFWRAKRYNRLVHAMMIRDGYKRAEYLKKIGYFKKQGDHCFFQIYNFGTEPELLSFGDNVMIASNVLFASHDITYMMFSNMDHKEYQKRQGEIIVGSNVFIGANTTLLYNVHIGNNVIIGAGSVVTRDIPDGSVAAGVPCRVIGSFDAYKEKYAVEVENS